MFEVGWASVGIEDECVGPVEEAAVCGVDAFYVVGSEVAGRAGSELAVAVPCLEGLRAVSEGVEPVMGIDHGIDGKRTAGVLDCQKEAGVACELAGTVSEARGIARFAQVRCLVENGAGDLGVVGP